jgi:uncharacterized protein HemY
MPEQKLTKDDYIEKAKAFTQLAEIALKRWDFGEAEKHLRAALESIEDARKAN